MSARGQPLAHEARPGGVQLFVGPYVHSARIATRRDALLHEALGQCNVRRHRNQSPAQVPQFTDPDPESASELIPALDQSITKAKRLLGGMDDAALMATWRLMRGEQELFAVPRVAFLRSVMLNHWYHHRGQLTVYLRALGVPIPSIYGPSADENPFA